MPRGDGTGPTGLGPMTGRKAGYYGGFEAPGFANPVPGYGAGRGRGGGGRRRGRGWRHGRHAIRPREQLGELNAEPEQPGEDE